MRHSLALFLLLTLVGCSTGGSKFASKTPDGKVVAEAKVSADDMYKEAKKSLDDGMYEEATKAFESLQSLYPYGRYAQQAQLEIAYAYYKKNEVEAALSAAERFIKQYPNNAHVDYAYYLKGLAHFNGDNDMFSSVSGEDPTERDPKAAQDSFAAFKDLVERFPNSKYAPDSILRMQYLVNALAKYEIHVARYYQRRGAHIAAVNRAKEVLALYPNTLSTYDALVIMVKSYDAMGLDNLRDDAQRVLDKNFPKIAVEPKVQHP
ncbi:MAG: outer membrane protein assembly factor BamD [Gallionella sp.]